MSVIDLSPENKYIIVPTHILPTLSKPGTDNLAQHLGSLYLEGNLSRDSWDIGLVYDTSSGAVTRPPTPQRSHLRKEKVMDLSKKIQEDERRFKDLYEQLGQMQSALNDVASTRKRDLLQRQEELGVALQRAEIIQKYETFDRLLQYINDQIFVQLDGDQKQVATANGLGYITKMLNPPRKLSQDGMEQLEYMLGCIPADLQQVASPLSNALVDLKRGQHALQHPSPTFDEAIMDVQTSNLQPSDKKVLIDLINTNPQSAKGDLFLAENGQSDVALLKARISVVQKELELLE